MLSALVIGIRDREARSQVELESLEKRQATDRSSPPSPRTPGIPIYERTNG